MNLYFNYIISGVIQGITEFIPVSSSGHLVILHRMLPIDNNNELAFDVLLHLATFIAVIWFFRKEIIILIKSWLRSFAGKYDNNSRIAWLIILATIPAGLTAYFFENLIETKFRSPFLVVIMLILVGALFIIFEKISYKKNSINDLSWASSLFIGIFQSLALIPGTSRSGITIIAGLWAKLKRQEAVKFSFLLSLPITLAAIIKKFPQVIFSQELISTPLILSFFAALITGILSIKYLLNYSKNNKLNIFAYYRFALAILIILFFL